MSSSSDVLFLADLPPDPAVSALMLALTRVRQWRSGDQRAPHKPLLLLLALGRLEQSLPRLASFSALRPTLTKLLARYGRHSQRPADPFWRLRLDGLWEVTPCTDLHINRDGLPAARHLLTLQGGFPVALHDLLAEQPLVREALTQQLLEAHFPLSLHPEIREAVGLGAARTAAILACERDRLVIRLQRPRSPAFRRAVLAAYGERCAICGFSARLDGEPLGLEAAHIQWHSHDGPDEVENGLCLCAIHHLALDRGAIGLEDDLRVRVSPQLLDRSQPPVLTDPVRGQRIHVPPGTAPPSPRFLRWHREQVFRHR